MTNLSGKIDYEDAWDKYAKSWQNIHPGQNYIGDEWIGQQAGAANSLAEYEALIENHLIAPYIASEDTVLEIGIGGGKTAALLLKHCQKLVCADISAEMLQATQQRLGEERVSYVKLDGLTLNGIPPGSMDVCFCYDTMVHIEPRDIYNYLVQIPPPDAWEALVLVPPQQHPHPPRLGKIPQRLSPQPDGKTGWNRLFGYERSHDGKIPHPSRLRNPSQRN
ncbi:class I SAM-dependent methyltransferase [Geitlerinema splendidum]|nr:class I SAM-dependent methyltransferase [Geitlerinema splendidum]